MKFILASTSKNRQAMLQKMGIAFESIAPDYEEVIDRDASPEGQIQEFALGKARSVYDMVKAMKPGRHEAMEQLRSFKASELQNILVLGCDSMIDFEGQSIGKPKDRAEAFEQISQFRSKPQRIMTGCALIGNVDGKYVENIFYESTSVQFRSDITDEQIENFLEFGDWEGKCGAYSILGTGIYFLEYIDGDFQNIIGIPVLKLGEALREVTGKSPLDIFTPN